MQSLLRLYKSQPITTSCEMTSRHLQSLKPNWRHLHRLFCTWQKFVRIVKTALDKSLQQLLQQLYSASLRWVLSIYGRDGVAAALRCRSRSVTGTSRVLPVSPPVYSLEGASNLHMWKRRSVICRCKASFQWRDNALMFVVINTFRRRVNIVTCSVAVSACKSLCVHSSASYV